ncbi:MAG: sugar ABC transporter substrate-binding protein [Acidimicrobiia bacterium]|nr:sugar ABC transporter substrate-binding protein [Acidimicrobiia bacterium]MYF84383.1 sugar ABC transporter substrate-binding protein [Acidimicrobiia bacterium]
MKIRLRYLFVLVLAFSFALAACQSDAEEPVPEPAPEPAPAEEVQEAAPAEEVEPVTLRFMFPEGAGRGPGFESAIAAYEEMNPHITIEMESVPFREYGGLLPVQFAGDSPADVALVDSSAVISYAYNGAIVPLDGIFEQSDVDDFLPSLVAQSTYEGSMYGAPFFISTQGVFYNVDMFAAAGVAAPTSVEEAWTWPEFVENVSKVAASAESDEGDVWGLVFLSNPPGSISWSLPVVRSNGEPGSNTFMALSPDGTEVSGYLDTPEAMEAYQFWQDLYVEHGLAPQGDVPDAFGNGQAATMISFSAWGSVLNNVFPDLNWDIMPIPYLETHVVHASHFMPTVASKSDHQEEAKAFVQFLSSIEGFSAYYDVTSDMPARVSLLNELEEFQVRPLSIFKDELLTVAYAAPGGPGGAIYAEIVGALMLDIAQGADIEAAVEAAVTELDAQLAQFG